MNEAMENFVSRVSKIDPQPGDTVNITIFIPDQVPERVEAIWLGVTYCVSLQIPFIKFVTSDNVRIVNSRFILEIDISTSSGVTEHLDKN